MATATPRAEAAAQTGSASQSRDRVGGQDDPLSAWTSTPSAAGTCCSAMMTAMPTVKPSTTGIGT